MVSTASAIPIRDIWKQKHHKAIRDMWIPSPLVWKCTKGQDSFLIRCLSRMSFQPKIMLCKDIQASSLALQQMGRLLEVESKVHFLSNIRDKLISGLLSLRVPIYFSS
ncbi:hypothetical protein ACB098_11G172100 [Castanea mollissima]